MNSFSERNLRSLTFRQFLEFLSASGVLLALIGCGATSSPGAGSLTSPEAISIANSAPASAGTGLQPIAAAAPTLEGILAAPADDDNIQVGEKGERIKRVHFEAFGGAPQFERYLSGAIWPSLLGNLFFLVKVGEETRPDCQGMEDPSCWKWLDPNLLKGVYMRAYVSTSRIDTLPNDPTRGVFVDGFYHQDFQLSEVQKGGYNLDLNSLKLREGDSIQLFLFNRKPEDFSLEPSSFYEAISIARGKGRHELGIIEIVNSGFFNIQIVQ